MIRGLHYHERGQDDLFVLPATGRPASSSLDRETGETFTRGHRRRQPGRGLRPGPATRTASRRSPTCLFCYHVTEEYDPADPDEHGIPWDDPRVVDLWSTRSPILSERDAAAAS